MSDLGPLAAPLASMRRDEPLSLHSSWRIGGSADLFFEPRSRGELVAAFDYARASGLKLLIIGRGTNLLFADAGYRGVIVKIGQSFAHYRIGDDYIDAGAGIPANRLARLASNSGMTGIEHIVGIPGTLGGLIIMNGGSRRECIGDRVVLVELLDRNGRVTWMRGADCGFVHRGSRFRAEDWTILSARIGLGRRPVDEIRKDMLEILRKRRSALPRKVPNCGSVFKNTPELVAHLGPAGRIIEECGLKGHRVGGAEVSLVHANCIANVGQASASDVLKVISHVRSTVYSRFGIWMETEVQYVHPLGAATPAHYATAGGPS